MTNPDSVESDDSFINVLASLPADEQPTVFFDFAYDTRLAGRTGLRCGRERPVSFTWAAHWRGEDEPRDRHDLRCPTWTDPGPVLDPEEDCDCRDLDGHTRDFHAGGQEQLDRFESYAGRPS